MQLKKLFIALAGLGLSASAFALTPLAVNGFNNPNSCSNWIFGVAGDYLQPLGNDFEYAHLVNGTITAPNSSGNLPTITTTEINEKAIDPDYDWGWQGLIDYRFPQTTNDIELNYTHFGSSNDDHVTAGPVTITPNSLSGSAVYPAGSDVPFRSVAGDLDTTFDAVNLDFGHTFNDGRLGVRVDGGLQWARIASDMKITGSGWADITDSTPPTYSGCLTSDSTFHGIGPSASLGATFDLGNGLSLYGEGRAVLLVGDINAESASTFSYTPYGGNANDTEIAKATFSGDNQTTLVPGGDAEAGISYTAPLGNNVGLTVQAGYMVAGYVHPVRHVFVSPASNNNVATTAVQASNGNTSIDNSHSDFGVQGPYIGVDLSF